MRRLLTDERHALDRLAARLLHDETVSHDTLVEILGSRPEAADPVEVA